MAGGGAVMRCEGTVADTEAHTKSAPEEEWRTFGGRDDEREIGGD